MCPHKEVSQHQLFQEDIVGSPKKSPVRIKLSSSCFAFPSQCKPLYLNSLVPRSDTVTELTCTLLPPMKVLTMKWENCLAMQRLGAHALTQRTEAHGWSLLTGKQESHPQRGIRQKSRKRMRQLACVLAPGNVPFKLRWSLSCLPNIRSTCHFVCLFACFPPKLLLWNGVLLKIRTCYFLCNESGQLEALEF